MNRLRIFLPVVVVLGCLAMLVVPMLPGGNRGAYDMEAFGRLPVSAAGRTKPLDSVARNNLLIVSDRQSAVVDGKPLSAIHWLLDVMARPDQANAYKVFRIDHPDVRSLIEANTSDQKRFSFNRLEKYGQVLNEQFTRVEDVKPADRTPYQRHLAELRDHVTSYFSILTMQSPYALPPLAEGEQWRPLSSELHAPHEGHEVHPELGPAAASLDGILRAYQGQDAEAFNAGVSEYAEMLGQHMPEEMRKARFEVFFNELQPFYQGTVLYVLAFLLGAGSLLLSNTEKSSIGKAMGRAAVAVVALTFCLHTFGLVARVYMQGYAPVTNLYSSAVFIGWFCVVMGLFMEWLFKNGLGTSLSAVIGFTTLIIAHNLADGDTMEMMRAVLDSNFWLSTHVTSVTIGYSATFMAGIIGIVYILAGVYTRRLDDQLAKTLGKMIYGTVAFGLLFSFVGTVLGGIWADQSWGRFWGWDPKENGAVLIVLMNALILHARWGGMVKTRGMAVLAVSGNIITAWSWFGTNMLGVGLHSYGFTESALFWMLVFVATQLAIMTAGMIPLSKWKSHTPRPPVAPPPSS